LNILSPILRFISFFLIIPFLSARVATPLKDTNPTPSHFLLGATIGIAIYSFFMTLVGFAGGIYNALLWTLLLFHGVLFWRLGYWWNHTKLKGLKTDWSLWNPSDLPSRIIFWLLIIFQAVMLVNSTAPHINSDAEVSHYLFLKNYAADGGISTFEANGFSYYPQSVEMALQTSFSLAGEHGPEAANMCLWLMQVLLICWLIDFCARRGKIRTGYFLAAAVSGIFYWPVIAYSGYIDGAVTLFSIAGVFTYFDWLSSRDKPVGKSPLPPNSILKIFHAWRNAGFTQLIVAGLFLGTACASKYSALPLTLLVVLHLVWLLITDKTSRGRTFISFLGFAVFLIIPMLPWYLRNIIETGNPVFPFLRGIFGGPDLALADDVNTWSTWGDITIGLKNYILYPIKLAFFYKLSEPWDFIRVPYTYMSWLFALAPLAGLFLLHRRIERIAAIWCFIFFTSVFFVMNSETRYFLPFTILALWLVIEWLDTLASGKPASELSDTPKAGYKKARWVWIMLILVLIPFVTQIDLTRNHFIERWPYISGQMTRPEYEKHVWPSTAVFERANEVSSPEKKICMFSLRTYRLDEDHIHPPGEIFAENSPFEINIRLSEQDVGYLLVESRIRQASILLSLLLYSDNPTDSVLIVEENILKEMGKRGVSRELTREFLKTIGGKRSVIDGQTIWNINFGRFRNPETEGLINFLALIDQFEMAGILTKIETTDSWELYELVNLPQLQFNPQ